MQLGRIFANAVSRLVAYVVVGLVVAWLGLTEARAGDQGEELANCQANAASWVAVSPSTRRNAKCTLSGNQWLLTGETYQLGIGWQESTIAYYPFTNTCGTKPSQITQFLPLTGSTQCWNGCVVSYMQNGDDTTSTRSHTGAVCSDSDFKNNCPVGTFWNGHMAVCQPIEPDCPTGQIRLEGQCKPENQCPDGMVAVQGSTPGAIQQGALYCKPAEEECPPGNIKSPTGQCLPGEGQCAEGEARRPNGTCGVDSDGDGEADEDDDDPNNDPDKESASGGDSCNQPPSCSGGPIDCMQVKIQWRIDCNTRKSRNIQGGACNAVPICTGEKCDALEYNSLVMQWRSACALEKMGAGEGNAPGGGDETTAQYMADARQADINQADAIAAEGDGHEGVSEDSIFGTFGNETFNPGMFGGGAVSSCNFTAPLELMGEPIDLSADWWMLAGMIGWLVVASAYIWLALQLGK